MPTPEQTAKNRQKTIARLQNGLLGDTDLEALTVFKKRALVWDASDRQDVIRTKHLTLGLGLAYSDLKDSGWAMQQWSYGEVATELPNAYRGQHLAMGGYFFRVMLGHFHELLNLIANIRPWELPPVRAALRRVSNSRAKRAWRNLLSAAKGEGDEHSKIAKFAYYARNVTAFHYDHSEVAKGYHSWRKTRRFSWRPSSLSATVRRTAVSISRTPPFRLQIKS